MAELGRTYTKQALARAIQATEGARLIGATLANTAISNVQDALDALKTAVDSKLDANHASVTNTRTPTDGSVTNDKVAAGAAIAEAKLSLASDAAAGTPSRRSLGTGASQALPGNHSSTTNTRTPTDGTVTDAKVAANAAIAESKLSLASDAAAGTASRRSLGTGSTQALPGNHSSTTDNRTPTDGSVTNAKVASDAAIAESKLSLASDAAAGTASRRTLGTGAAQAAPGNHTHAKTFSMPFAFAGIATPRVSNPFPNHTNRTIKRVTIAAEIAPVGGPLTAEVRIGGVVVAGGTISLPAGQTSVTTASLEVTLPDLAILTVAITNGGTTPAEKVTVSVETQRMI